MTTNAFIFVWDKYGIESIIPITQFENWDATCTWEIIKGNNPGKNPLNSILTNVTMRARFNAHRCYEIYTIDCGLDLDEEFWKEQWQDDPQGTADLIRERGIKILSQRNYGPDAVIN